MAENLNPGFQLVATLKSDLSSSQLDRLKRLATRHSLTGPADSGTGGLLGRLLSKSWYSVEFKVQMAFGGIDISAFIDFGNGVRREAFRGWSVLGLGADLDRSVGRCWAKSKSSRPAADRLSAGHFRRKKRSVCSGLHGCLSVCRSGQSVGLSGSEGIWMGFVLH